MVEEYQTMRPGHGDQFYRLDRRQFVINSAKGALGLGYRDVPPGNRVAYIHRCWPPETPYGVAESYAKTMISCMLATSGILRDMPEMAGERKLFESYEHNIGMIGPIVTNIAKKYNAWFAFTDPAQIAEYLERCQGVPSLGDIFWIGLDDQHGPVPGWGGTSHMFTIIDQKQEDLPHGEVTVLHSSDGGQNNPVDGSMEIHERTRWMEVVNAGQRNQEAWMRTCTFNDKTGVWSVAEGRRIFGAFDPTLLP